MMRRDSKFNGPVAAEVLARGKGKPGSHAEYEAYMRNGGSLDVLRDAARFDPAAMHELVTQYRRLPAPELERLRAAGDIVADQVSTHPTTGPQMDPAADARLAEAMWERRRTAIEQAEEQARGAQGVRTRQQAERAVADATHEGTIGSMETDIPGIAEFLIRGSPQAPQGTDPAPADARRYSPPRDDAKALPASAEHHAEDKFVNHLDAEFGRLGLSEQALIGRTVRISVDQGVCQSCAAGWPWPPRRAPAILPGPPRPADRGDRRRDGHVQRVRGRTPYRPQRADPDLCPAAREVSSDRYFVSRIR